MATDGPPSQHGPYPLLWQTLSQHLPAARPLGYSSHIDTDPQCAEQGHQMGARHPLPVLTPMLCKEAAHNQHTVQLQQEEGKATAVPVAVSRALLTGLPSGSSAWCQRSSRWVWGVWPTFHCATSCIDPGGRRRHAALAHCTRCGMWGVG